MGSHLRALAVLPEDLNSESSTHIRKKKIASNSNFRKSNAFCSLRAPSTHMVHMHICRHSDIHMKSK